MTDFSDLNTLNLLNIPNILPFHGLFSGLKPSQVQFIGDCVANYKPQPLRKMYYKIEESDKQRLIKAMEKSEIGTILEANQSSADVIAGKSGRRHFWKKTEIGIFQVDTNIEVTVMFDVFFNP